MSKGYYAIDKSGQLRHYKYVKREKKNGKWVYYYDDDLGGGRKVTDTKPARVNDSVKAKRDTKSAPKDSSWSTGIGAIDKVKDWLGYDEAVRANAAADSYRFVADVATDFKKNKYALKAEQEYKDAMASVKANSDYKPTSDSDRRHAANSKAAAEERAVKAAKTLKAEKNWENVMVNEAVAKAGRDYVAAQEAYNKTPLAKIRNATGKVKEQIDKGMKAVHSWLDNLTKRFKKK